MAKHLNLKNVEHIAHGDRFFIRSILSVFAEESENYWFHVTAFFKKDLVEFRKAVHKAKSAAANIAESSLVDDLLRIELDAEQKEQWPTEAFLKDVEARWKELVEEARDHVTNGG